MSRPGHNVASLRVNQEGNWLEVFCGFRTHISNLYQASAVHLTRFQPRDLAVRPSDAIRQMPKVGYLHTRNQARLRPAS